MGGSWNVVLILLKTLKSETYHLEIRLSPIRFVSFPKLFSLIIIYRKHKLVLNTQQSVGGNRLFNREAS